VLSRYWLFVSKREPAAPVSCGRQSPSTSEDAFDQPRTRAVIRSLLTWAVPGDRSDLGRFDGRRERQVLKALAASGGSFAAQISFTLVALPVAKSTLGTDQFVTYGKLSVVMLWVTTANISTGPYLSLKIPDSLARKSEQGALRAVSAAFAVASVVSLLIGALFIVPGARDLVADVISADSGSLTDLAATADAILIVALAAAAGTTVSVAEAVRLGLQERHIATLWSMAGTIGATIAVLIVSWTQPSLAALVVAALVTPLVGRVSNAVLLWFRHHPNLRPRLHQVRFVESVQVLKTNGLFTAVQISGLLGWPVALILVSKNEAPGIAAGFYVVILLATLAGAFVSALVTPMLPALRDASAVQEVDWLRRGIKAVLGVAMSVAVGFLLLLVFGGPLIGMVFGSDAVPSLPLRVLLGTYFGIMILEFSFYTIALAFLSHTRLAAIILLRGAVSLLLLVLLVPDHGAVGAAVALLVGVGLTSLWSYALMFVHLSRELRGRATSPRTL